MEEEAAVLRACLFDVDEGRPCVNSDDSVVGCVAEFDGRVVNGAMNGVVSVSVEVKSMAGLTGFVLSDGGVEEDDLTASCCCC